MMFLGDATTPMQDLTTGLTQNITPASLIQPVIDILPWVAGILAVAVGLYFVRRAIKKASKVKAGI